MRKFIRRASELRARHGLGGVLREGFDKTLQRAAATSFVRVLVLESGDDGPRQARSDVDLRFLTVEEVAHAAGDASQRIAPEFVERARAGLDLCFGAFCEGRLASYGWYALDSIEAEHAAGLDLGLPPETAYLYKGFTHADFRGQHLYPACMLAALAALRPRGIDRLVAFVHWSNRSALRSCERIGYRSLGMLVVGPRGPLRIPIAARRLGLRFGADAAAALAARRAKSAG